MRLPTLAALSTAVLWSLCPPTASTLDTPSQPPVRATAPTLGNSGGGVQMNGLGRAMCVIMPRLCSKS